MARHRLFWNNSTEKRWGESHGIHGGQRFGVSEKHACLRMRLCESGCVRAAAGLRAKARLRRGAGQDTESLRFTEGGQI